MKENHCKKCLGEFGTSSCLDGTCLCHREVTQLRVEVRAYSSGYLGIGGSNCRHNNIENNMVPDTCRDCGLKLVEPVEQEETFEQKTARKLDKDIVDQMGEKESWKERLLKQFGYHVKSGKAIQTGTYEELRNFIEKELASTLSAERTRIRELVERLEITPTLKYDKESTEQAKLINEYLMPEVKKAVLKIIEKP